MKRYEKRFYRYQLVRSDLVTFQVSVKETDLWIRAAKDLSGVARDLVITYRNHIEDFIRKNPDFLTSLTPLPTPDFTVPAIVRQMIIAGQKANTGPMAAVAGAIAERVGKKLLDYSDEVIVENGGDCFIGTRRTIEVGIYAGDSPLSNKVALRFKPERLPLGVCTSSGTIGHSLSFGKADAITVISKNAALADAAATAIGNVVKTSGDIGKGLELAQNIEELAGIVIIVKDKLGAWGEVELVKW